MILFSRQIVDQMPHELTSYRPRWEYQFLRHSAAQVTPSFVDVMNTYGGDGWEVCGWHLINDAFYFVVKRLETEHIE